MGMAISSFCAIAGAISTTFNWAWLRRCTHGNMNGPDRSVHMLGKTISSLMKPGTVCCLQVRHAAIGSQFKSQNGYKCLDRS